MTSAKAELLAALGAPPTPEVSRLSAADTRRLAGLVDAARAEQRCALDEAVDGGLGHLPRILRGAVRAALLR